MRKLALALLLLAVAFTEPFAVRLTAQQQRGVYMEDINRNVNACENFFDYANGAWRAANPIPASMQRWSRRWQAGEKNKDALKTILDDVTQRTDWARGSIDQQISDFYRSCMDEKAIEAAGLKPIAPLLAEIDRIDGPASLQKAIATLHELQVSVPFGVTSQNDSLDPNQVIARIYAAGLGLPDRDYYVKPEPRFADARVKYQAHVARVFELAGASKAAAKKAADTVFAMETRLAKMHLDNVELRDPHATDHKYMVATLQKMTPHFDWTRYLERAAIPSADLNVDQPLFMQAVDKELATTPLSAWRTYLRWSLLNAASPNLSNDFVTARWEFYSKYLAGAKEMKPRWKRCIETEDALIGEALGQRYVERYFPPQAKARMKELVTNLLAAMGDTIRGLDWMGPATKQQALEKLSTFNPKVGYPDKWKDYSHVEIRPGSHWQNVIEGIKFTTADDHAQIGKPVDRGRWGMTPPTSDAYYNPPLNEIVFPAGILQSPAFDVNATDTVNYGAIGVVIGHEISHGFDDQGAQYDAQGRLRNWWTAEDLKRFQERAQCVVNQYEEYFIEPTIHHNGKLVLGESIGDIAGAKIAYLALQKAQQKNPGRIIDGLTPDQQFFVAWGQFRGDEIRPEMQRLMIQGDPHPIAKYRVIGPISNLPAFAKAFDCKADSPMVRAEGKRCVVW